MIEEKAFKLEDLKDRLFGVRSELLDLEPFDLVVVDETFEDCVESVEDFGP